MFAWSSDLLVIQPLTHELKLLDIEKIHLFTVGIFMYEDIHNDICYAFNSMLSYRGGI